MIVVIEKNATGEIEFTQEQLEELLEKARQEGVKEAQKPNYIYTNTYKPVPLQPNTPFQSPVICGATPKAMSEGTSTLTTIAINGTEATNDI